jgi:hypothetical protein
VPLLFSAAHSDGQLPETSAVHTSGAAAARYSWKFSVVPDSSLRCTTVIGVSGNSASGFCSAIAGSFHSVISPVKTWAMVSPSMFTVSTPGRLKATAIGEM